jgi:2-amino-4-hydroxy-6-hydroxymethyldihydropteridine diphosphokinase
MSGDVRRSYVVGLGANLGERVATLKSAVLALQAHGEVQAISHLYETTAVGPPQPDYLNAAVLLAPALLQPSAALKASRCWHTAARTPTAPSWLRST